LWPGRCPGALAGEPGGGAELSHSWMTPAGKRDAKEVPTRRGSECADKWCRFQKMLTEPRGKGGHAADELVTDPRRWRPLVGPVVTSFRSSTATTTGSPSRAAARVQSGAGQVERAGAGLEIGARHTAQGATFDRRRAKLLRSSSDARERRPAARRTATRRASCAHRAMCYAKGLPPAPLPRTRISTTPAVTRTTPCVAVACRVVPVSDRRRRDR